MASVYKYEALVEGVGRDLKQSMKECERKLKKTPKDLPLLLFKASLLLKQRQYAQAEELCTQFSKMGITITEQRFIDEIFNIYGKCLTAQQKDLLAPDKALFALWETLIKSAGPNARRELLAHVFRTSVALGFWETAQMAVIMLKKERPKDPQYFYIYILVTQLLSRIYKSRAPGQSQVFGQMALKMTLKAVETTFRNGDDNVPVNSSQILRFIIQILREQGAYQELYSTLYDLQMEKKTSLKSDIEFIRARLDCLASNQRWKDLGTVGILLVTNAAARREPWTYDWTVWEHTALGNVELDSARINPPGFPKWFESFIDADTVDPSSPRYRSVWLGVLTYRLRMPKTFENEIPSLLYYCSEYLRLHHFQRYCFKDLRQFVERLDPNSMQEFQELSHQIAYQSRPVHAQTDTAKDWTISELNALKFDYLLSISVFEKPVRAVVEAFVANVLRFAKLLDKMDGDFYALDEAYLLAARALRKLASILWTEGNIHDKFRECQVPTVQALYLMNDLLSSHPDHYGAQVVLIELAKELGLISVAMQTYQGLRIREIQHETLSHMLFNRISLIHPFEVTGPERPKLESAIADPYKGLGKVLTWYDTACDKIDGFLAADIKEYRYDKATEFYELKKGLQKSLWKQLAVTERRRIARLTDRSYDETDSLDMLAGSWISDTVDFRDFVDAHPFGCSMDLHWYSHSFPDAMFARAWLRQTTFADIAQSSLVVKDPVAEQRSMEARGRVLKESETDDHVKQMSQSLGPREQRTQAFWIAMCNPCTVAAHPYDDRMDVSRMSTEEAKVALRHIETFVNGATLPTPRLHNVLPIALVLSDTIELLEVLKFSYRFLDMATTQSRNKSHAFYRNVSSDDVDRIKGLIKNRAELIFEFVRNWRDNILRNEQTILWDRHFEGSIGAVLKELINHKELRKVIPNFRNSAVDSLDGILKIKVP